MSGSGYGATRLHHLRQRSVTLESGGLLDPSSSSDDPDRISPTSSLFSDGTTVNDSDGDDGLGGYHKTTPTFGYDPLDRLVDRLAGKPSWRGVVETRRRILIRRIIGWGVVVGLIGGGWAAGRATSSASASGVAVAAAGLLPSIAEFSTSTTALDRMCNPYDYEGVLLVNTSVAAENKWEPVGAPVDCTPVDFLSLIAAHTTKGEKITNPELDFMRNRTIAVMGDSIDRDHLWHFCNLAGGWTEMIGVDHPLSPPYPPGQELPDVDYIDPLTGKREWPNFGQSRPFVCHLNNNFRIVQVFHYGFRGRTNMIAYHGHFYPPAKIEDRFDLILVPLLASLAAQYEGSATPDILEITPGIWGTLRLSADDDRARQQLIASGATPYEAELQHSIWSNMKQKHREWLQGRMETVLRHLGKGFLPRGASAEDLASRKPAILWRALHHIQTSHSVPFNRVQSVDQIGRAVVRMLVAEGQSALLGERSWMAWVKKAKTYVTGIHSESESEVLQAGLGSRLHIDEWGSKMLGQENHFVDTMHPLPLPGSYLWGNMILQQLKMVVASEGVRA